MSFCGLDRIVCNHDLDPVIDSYETRGLIDDILEWISDRNILDDQYIAERVCSAIDAILKKKLKQEAP